MQAQSFVAEEAERLYAWCRDFGGLTAQDAAEWVNEPSVREDELNPSAMLYIAMNHIFTRCVAFYPEYWPAGTEPWPLQELPLWVRAGWDRYFDHQLTGGIYQDELTVEDELPF